MHKGEARASFSSTKASISFLCAHSLSYLTGLFFSSGSLAATTPTSAPIFVSSWTSMMVPSLGWKMGGSSMSETLTRTMVWSRNEPKSTKRGSTCLFTASTTTLCERLFSKSSGWKIKCKKWYRLPQEQRLFKVTSCSWFNETKKESKQIAVLFVSDHR